MNKKAIRIIAAICFILYAAFNYGVVFLFNANTPLSYSLGNLLLPIAALVVGIGLFMSKSAVSAIGSLLFAVGYFLTGNLFYYLRVLFYRPLRFITSSNFLLFVSAILLLILCFVKSSSKVLGIISALLTLIAKVLSIITTLKLTTHPPTAIFFVREVLLLAGLFLIGFAIYQKKEKAQKTHSRVHENSTPADSAQIDGYCGLVKHILLLLFTFGVWHYIWIYRATDNLNRVPGEEYRHPTKKLLLCMFVPFYIIYWTYKSAQRIDKLATVKGIQSDLSTLCLILEIFVPIIPPILMQDKINAIVTAENTVNTTSSPKPANPENIAATSAAPVNTAEELKSYKELLDMGIITQEEFDAKKKQLLGL